MTTQEKINQHLNPDRFLTEEVQYMKDGKLIRLHPIVCDMCGRIVLVRNKYATRDKRCAQKAMRYTNNKMITNYEQEVKS